MASLYELTQNVMYLQDLLEAGEIDDQTFADSIESMCIDDKLENICKMMKNLEAKAAAFKAEEDRMAQRRKTLENGVRRLKDSALAYMLTAEAKKVEAGLFTLSVGTSKSARVTNPSLIPEEYLKPQPPAIDKASILKKLKAGEIVEGAELAENPFLTIR